MSGRTVILSDTHLGRPRGAARSAWALRPLWAGATRLIINGDVAEVHHARYRSEAARQVLRLASLCEEDGVELTLLSGNHDPYLSDLRHLHLEGGSVLVMHGDVLHPAIAPWSPAAVRMRRAHEYALTKLDEHERGELSARLAAVQFASHIEWADGETCESSLWSVLIRPAAAMRVLRYWRIVPRLAERFAAQHAPEARYVVIGHTHRPGIWPFEQRTVINTGCYGFPGRPRAVVIEDGELAVHAIEQVCGYYHLAGMLAKYELPAEAGVKPPIAA